MRRFSAWGYLAFTLWGLVMALTVEGWQLAALAVLELAFGLAWSRDGLGPLRRWRFWIFVSAGVALGPWMVRRAGLPGDAAIVSYVGLSMGLEMAGRAFTLLLAFSLGLSSLSLSDLTAIFDRLHMRGLGFALGVAMNLLRNLQDMARVTFETIKLRGGLRRPAEGLRLFLVTLVSNTLRYGDEVVQAAAVRAFDPEREGGHALSVAPADRWLFSLLIGCSLACYLL